MNIEQRVEALRDRMRKHELNAYIIPSSDPHQSEYPPAHWKARQWISGFEGSAGTVVVTGDTAGLWTDARYYLEAEEALRGTPIHLFRSGEQDVPDYVDWLATHLEAGDRVGFDGSVMALETSRNLESVLSNAHITVHPVGDLLEPLWQDRPPLPDAPAYLIENGLTGESREEKLERVRSAIEETGTQAHIIATLDDIAWVLNIRGSDVPFNPVILAYLAVQKDTAHLFVDETKLSDGDRNTLTAAGVTIEPYDALGRFLAHLPSDTPVLYDPARVGAGLAQAFPTDGTHVERRNPSTDFKARKNTTELSHIRSCMISDGVAMEQFFYWLEQHAPGGPGGPGEPGGELTEQDIAVKLAELRAARPGFVNESFDTIAGYGAHGAIVHYRVTPDTNARIKPGAPLLVDSGGQYRTGTTDITRTVSVGEPTEEVRTDFTLVLKAHIALATTQFPRGTTGHQLDAIPRRLMWHHGANYGHGTGHGVGFFLNVHEGPQRISPLPNSVALKPGMVISNEPGLYRPGRHGIRIENLVVVGEGTDTEFDRFLTFETVTLCHIERSLIDATMLSTEEREWVDSYHDMVWERIGGEVSEPIKSWLREKTAPL
ncbi:MAG: aminopeptidase P family protein [Spirochaetia bacterium]